MNFDLEQKLWNAVLGSDPYSKDTWYEIIDALLDDFRKFIGQDFERDPEISLNITRRNSPSICQWMWSKKESNFPTSTIWSAVIGGNIVGTENGENVFGVSITLFLFDANNKKRLCLITGESTLEFVFEKGSDGHGYWKYLGWIKDEWGEWEDVEYE
jgi:hypothetical protein